jgi:hypothetical protein
MSHHLNEGLAQLYAPALLISESADEHNYLRNALQQQIQPENFIEHLWVADLLDGEHEMARLRRFKSRMIRSNTARALGNLLRLVTDIAESDQIDDLVAKWFTNKAAKRTVARILRDFGLDEASIDAEALRLSMAAVAVLERRTLELEHRREKILRRIDDHRAGLAIQVGRSFDRVPEDGAVVSARTSPD